MASVRKTVSVTTVKVLVADPVAKTVNEVSEVFAGKRKVNNRLVKYLSAKAERSGLKFVEISGLSYGKEKYEMPLEMFMQMATKVEE